MQAADSFKWRRSQDGKAHPQRAGSVGSGGGLARLGISAFAATATPTITSFAPLTAKAGATVTITGKNLTGASAVEFDGMKATSFKVASATKITAKVPSKAKSGKISVTTKGGTAMSSSSLKV